MNIFTTVQKNTRTNPLKSLFVIGLISIGSMALIGCQNNSQETNPLLPGVKVAEESHIALVVSPAPEGVGNVSVYPGTIEASRRLPVGFPLAGRLIERFARVGQIVKSGALLARLDPQLFQFQHQAANANVTLQNAGLHLAMKDAGRAKQLLSEQFVSPAFFEKLKSQQETTQAGVERAIAERAIAYKNLKDTELRAPFTGVVVSTSAESGQSLTAGQPVVYLAEDSVWDIVLSVPEQDLTQWAVGTSVIYTLLADASRARRSGRVRELSPQADPITRSYIAKVAIVPEDKKLFSLGASVKVARIESEDKKVTRYKVPMGAVYQLQGETIVWVVVDQQRIAPQPVRLVGYYPSGAIVEAKFAQNTFIVGVGAHLLRDGQRIQPELWLQWMFAHSTSAEAAGLNVSQIAAGK